MDYIILVLVILLAGILVYLHHNNKKLLKENSMLREILEVKNTTITNLEASRVAVKDVIEHLSMHEEVMHFIEAGESRSSISKKLNIPLSKIELIVKFNKIKNASS
ncbi:MAG: sigma-70 family RNA polymerase sigma factor [Campylobacterota bacterium]|nr:sigma-70 family RNA polymerase sigma factor [Campylobacterota bacterium]